MPLRFGDEGQYEQEAWGERVNIANSEEMIQTYLEEHGGAVQVDPWLESAWFQAFVFKLTLYIVAHTHFDKA
jgi:hypothetical protein